MSLKFGHLILCLLLCGAGWSCSTKGMIRALTAKDDVSWEDEPIVTVSPGILYYGDNILTIRSNRPLSQVEVIRHIISRVGESSAKGSIHVEGAGKILGCPLEHTVKIRIDNVGDVNSFFIRTKDCSDNVLMRVQIPIKSWLVDRITFPKIKVGETECKEFVIGLQVTGESAILDSVTVPEGLPIRLGFADAEGPVFPIGLKGGETLWYNVCFTGEEPGDYIIPIITWMRREEPVGQLTTYPVADTAIIRVVRK